jgi:hypothetical protein
MNPFQMVKARLLKQKESQETENSSQKDRKQGEEGLAEIEERKTITFK